MAYPHHLKLITTLSHHGANKGYTARSGKGDEHEVVVEGALRGFLTDDYTARTEGGVEILYLYRPEDPGASDKPKYAPIQLSCPLNEEQLIFVLSAIDWLLELPIVRVAEGFDEAYWIVEYPAAS